jgi:hypothetical protein
LYQLNLTTGHFQVLNAETPGGTRVPLVKPDVFGFFTTHGQQVFFVNACRLFEIVWSKDKVDRINTMYIYWIFDNILMGTQLNTLILFEHIAGYSVFEQVFDAGSLGLLLTCYCTKEFTSPPQDFVLYQPNPSTPLHGTIRTFSAPFFGVVPNSNHSRGLCTILLCSVVIIYLSFKSWASKYYLERAHRDANSFKVFPTTTNTYAT